MMNGLRMGLNFALPLSICCALGDSPTAAQNAPVAAVSTPPIGLSATDEQALRNAQLIADRLKAANAAGLKTAMADPEVRKAIGDLRTYVQSANSSGLQAIKWGHVDPAKVIIIAAVAGELSLYKKDFNELRDAYHRGQFPGAAGEMLVNKLSDKVATKMAQRLTGGSSTPTPVVLAAKTAAKFIVAYENGFIDKIAPRGVAPLLEKNSITSRWLDDVRTSLNTTATASVPSGSKFGAPSSPIPNSQPTAGRATPPSSSTHVWPPQPNPASTSSGSGGRQASRPLPQSSTPAEPSPTVLSSAARPGGISLTKAAAERTPLNIQLDGSYYSDGRVVFTGKPDTKNSLDAALFLTTLRLSCEQSDPSFSLDPIAGGAWNSEGSQAATALWDRVGSNFSKKLNAQTKDSIFSLRTVSATRDFPEVWRSMQQNYSNFKSQLVFQPSWLAETRVGEILYKGDVLLKELSGGVPVLEAGALRASKIDTYASADARHAAQGLLESFERKTEEDKPTWQGHRLWFDLTSHQPHGAIAALEPIRFVKLCEIGKCAAKPGESALRKILAVRGLLEQPSYVSKTPQLASDGDALDLSAVYPKMFVRRHEQSTRTDLPGSSPSLDDLSNDVNNRIEKYAMAYKELQALIEVFRAYLASVHVTAHDPSICTHLRTLPLMDSERVASPMPEHHPTELFFTVASFEYSTKRLRRRSMMRAYSLNGGVTIRANAYFDEALRSGTPTEITKIINNQSALAAEKAVWRADDNRHFIAFLTRSEAAEGSKGVLPLTPAAIDTPKPEYSPTVPSPPLQTWPSEKTPTTETRREIAKDSVATRNSPSSVPSKPSTSRPVSDYDSQGLMVLIVLGIGAMLLLAFFVLPRRRSPGPAAAAMTPVGGRYPNGAWAMPDLSSSGKTATSAQTPTQEVGSSAPVWDQGEFASVFFNLTRSDRERMVQHWMKKRACDRIEAMRLAVEDWRRDQRSWA